MVRRLSDLHQSLYLDRRESPKSPLKKRAQVPSLTKNKRQTLSPKGKKSTLRSEVSGKRANIKRARSRSSSPPSPRKIVNLFNDSEGSSLSGDKDESSTEKSYEDEEEDMAGRRSHRTPNATPVQSPTKSPAKGQVSRPTKNKRQTLSPKGKKSTLRSEVSEKRANIKKARSRSSSLQSPRKIVKYFNDSEGSSLSGDEDKSSTEKSDEDEEEDMAGPPVQSPTKSPAKAQVSSLTKNKRQTLSPKCQKSTPRSEVSGKRANIKRAGSRSSSLPSTRKIVKYFNDSEGSSLSGDEDKSSTEKSDEDEEEDMAGGRSRQTSNATPVQSRTKSPAKARKATPVQSHTKRQAKAKLGKPSPPKSRGGTKEQLPPVSEMVLKSIRALKENPRKGSTIGRIKETIVLTWPSADSDRCTRKIKNFILEAAETGELVRVAGKGAKGRFTVPGLKVRRKKRSSPAKAASENGDDEAIYQPQKTQRDEDREKDQAELEQRRLERIETQRRINEEKALKPKKVVNRKKDYDVEAIKGFKEVKGNKMYLVKFEGWPKPQWEPLENVENCQDLIKEYMVLHREREDELSEIRRLAEEEDHYEVAKVLDVKFKKNKTREFLVRWRGFSKYDDSWVAEADLNAPEKIEKYMIFREKALASDEKELREAPKKVALIDVSTSRRGVKRGRGIRVSYVGMDD